MALFLKNLDNQLQSLAVDQEVTGSWEDLSTVQDGPWLDTADILAIALWLKIAINDSQDLRIRMACKASSTATDVYLFPIESVESTVVNVSTEYKELTDDVTQNIILPYAISDNFPLVKFQIQAGSAGATPATITAGVTFTT